MIIQSHDTEDQHRSLHFFIYLLSIIYVQKHKWADSVLEFNIQFNIQIAAKRTNL